MGKCGCSQHTNRSTNNNVGKLKEHFIIFPALEVVLEGLVKRAGEVTEAAVAIQQKVAEVTKKHTQLLKKAMEDTSDVSF